jgi:hypothetical protein
MNRQYNGHGTLRELDTSTFRFGNLQVIGHQVKLLARHPKCRVIVDFHRADNKSYIQKLSRRERKGN